MVTGEARARYICIVADTTAITAAHPEALRKASAADAALATTVTAGVMATSTARTEGQGTAHLALAASTGDLLRFYATSGSYGFESAALIAAIHTNGHRGLLQDFELVDLQQAAVTPDPSDPRAVAQPSPTQDFWFWQCTIAGEGTQHCRLIVALYERDDEGQPRFAGTYRWDLTLTINSTEPSNDNN